MKKIGILPDIYKDPDYLFTNEVINFLLDTKRLDKKGNQVKVYLLEDVGVTLDKRDLIIDNEGFYQQSDLILVLGGDGAVLKASHKACIYNKPILGINLGTLGYLTDVDKSECFESLTNYLDESYKIEKRIMLSFEPKNFKIGQKNFEAHDTSEFVLNDICITRGKYNSLIIMELFINDEYIDTYKADGLIVSTPTGSTAYNLSAGGPILKYDSKMIVITPICPHMLHSRPIVVPSDDTITIRVSNKRSTDVILSADGIRICSLDDMDTIIIKESEKFINIIKTKENGFYDVLRRKMVGLREET